MKKKITQSVSRVLSSVDDTVSHVEQEVGSFIEPMQKTVFSRFPTVFTLLVTFGVAATFFGFERIIVEFAYINDRPLLMLSIGIGVLTLTGTLYKKLG